MQLGEVYQLLCEGKTLDEIRKEHLYGASKPRVSKLLKECGLIYKSGGQGKPIWGYEENKTDLSVNVLHKLFFEGVGKPDRCYKWDISRGFVSFNEIQEIILLISNCEINPYTSYDLAKQPVTLLKLTLYIKEFISHPLDALFIKSYMLKGIIKASVVNYVVDLIRTVSFCLALKYKIYVPFNISFNIFKSYGLNAFLSLSTNNGKMMIPQEKRLSVFGKILLSYIEDGDEIVRRLEYISITENAHRTVLTRGNKIIYYMVSFLLAKEKVTNKWDDFSIRDINVNHLLHIFEHGFLDSRKIGTVNCLFYVSFGIDNLLSIKVLKNIAVNEIERLFNSYLIYRRLRKLSSSNYIIGTRMLSLKPSHILHIKDLTKDNLMEWIKDFYIHAKENNMRRKNVMSVVACFLGILADIKSIIQDNGILGIKAIIPIDSYEISSKMQRSYGDYNLEANVKSYSRGEKPISLFKLSQELASNLEENMEYGSGTFKTKIQYADELVSAIYNYKITAEKGTIEYFNELQRIAMLRIMADSGVRSLEVINTPFGTHSYLKNYDVNICILGWSKFFDRFGVVPISKSTSKILEECTRIRKEQFPESLVPMSIKNRNKTKGTSKKYVLQFVSLHSIHKHAKRVDGNKLAQQLDKVCKQARIERKQGTRFHFLRHRAAEYFFFCASYYDFEGKDDYEYKQGVVKKLLRHVDVEMTKEYYWGELLNLIAEKKLVFYKDLSQMERLVDEDSLGREAKREAQRHIDSIKNRINKDLGSHLTQPNIDKIVRLFTVPFDYVDDTVLESVSKSQNFSVILEHLTRLDGNKSPVPPGSAYFGMCLNFSCPKLKERTTCISCNEQIVEEKDIPRMIGELVRCNAAIQDIYQNYNSARNDHLESIRARSISNANKLKDLGLDGIDVLKLMREHIQSKKVGI
ncbi:site-specific integrase [Priestia endophytica]|uniref:site-specific integrase n=1 Tax=Priestia endophytica TaxID=135735 RepID=UPI000DCA51F2|nr:site-specific integrase [Priestia endophytica]RAS83084.1 hypothetical protein A4R27_08035 [Priestia endophytica]